MEDFERRNDFTDMGSVLTGLTHVSLTLNSSSVSSATGLDAVLHLMSSKVLPQTPSLHIAC